MAGRAPATKAESVCLHEGVPVSDHTALIVIDCVKAFLDAAGAVAVFVNEDAH